MLLRKTPFIEEFYLETEKIDQEIKIYKLDVKFYQHFGKNIVFQYLIYFKCNEQLFEQWLHPGVISKHFNKRGSRCNVTK